MGSLVPVLVLVVALLPRVLLPAQVVGCSSQDLASLLASDVVNEALEDAYEDMWEDVEPTVSDDPDPDEQVTWDDEEAKNQAKEQGGWIYDCQNPDGSWSIRIVRWPEGDYGSVAQGPKLDDPACQLVGEFHTHTGSHSLHPLNDGSPNEQPSKADTENADENGVPGIIVYGHKGDPGSYGISTYGSSKAPSTPCPDDGGHAESAGEPHLRTFDGLSYDFQAAGEFVLVRSTVDELEVQARQEPTATGHVTMNTAVAVRIDGSTVEVDESRVVVDGVPRQRAGFEPIETPGGGRVTDDNGTVRFRWRDGSEMAFVGRAVVLRLSDDRAGAVEGLLGNFDGDPGDDLIGAGGARLYDDERLGFDELHGDLADAWRLGDADTRFTYPAGVTTRTFDRRDIPGFRFDRASIDPSALADAEARCREAGIEDRRRFDNCVFDVAATGDDAFAREAAAVEAEVSRPRATAGGDAFLEAVGLQRTADVRQLLADGADPNEVGGDGRSALIVAVYTGNRELVELLLEAGADPAGRDRAGSTALHVAAFWGFDDIAEALLAGGADAGATDDGGRTPADVARAQGHDALAETLS